MAKGSKPRHAKTAGKQGHAATSTRPKGVVGASSPSSFTATRREALAILAIAERTFARLESEGILAPASRGRGGRASVYDLRLLVPAYLQYVTGNKPTDDRAARSRRDQSQAELNELKLSQQRHELVAVGDVELAGQSYTKAWTALVRGLPRRLVHDGLIPREQEAGVLQHCVAILTEIASWRSVADAEGAATKGAAA